MRRNAKEEQEHKWAIHRKDAGHLSGSRSSAFRPLILITAVKCHPLPRWPSVAIVHQLLAPLFKAIVSLLAGSSSQKTTKEDKTSYRNLVNLRAGVQCIKRKQRRKKTTATEEQQQQSISADRRSGSHARGRAILRGSGHKSQPEKAAGSPVGRRTARTAHDEIFLGSKEGMEECCSPLLLLLLL